jgi:anti-sigma-K factor RskA
VGGRRDVEIATLKDEIAFLRGEVRGAQEAIQLVSSPGVVVIDLAGQGPAASGAARIFWDRGRSVWQLYAANLPRPAAGRTYQLWVITADQRKIGAGTFGAGAAGEASLRAGLAVDAGAVAAAAVTEEPEGGSPQPTGPIVLLGKV